MRVMSSDKVPPGAAGDTTCQHRGGLDDERGSLTSCLHYADVNDVNVTRHTPRISVRLTQHSASHQDVEECLSIPAVVKLGARGVKEPRNCFQISASVIQA